MAKPFTLGGGLDPRLSQLERTLDNQLDFRHPTDSTKDIRLALGDDEIEIIQDPFGTPTLIGVIPSGSGSSAWGSITGTLSAQTDLQAALDAKVPTSRTVTAGTGLTGGGDLTANRTLTLADTAVTPGNYASSPAQTASFTVDAQGRITAASSNTIEIAAGQITSGSFGVGFGGTGLTSLTTGSYIRAASSSTFEQRTAAQTLGDIGAVPTSRTITAGTGLSGGGDLSANRTISLANTAVTSGTYGGNGGVTTSFTVDAQGRITGAAQFLIEIDAAVVFGQFVESQIANDAVTNAKLRNSAALSVIGRSANSTGDPGDIVFSADHQVIRRSGTTVGAGAVNLASSNAVTGALPIANGGTGSTTAANARTALGLGTAATVNTGTSGATIPLLNGNNTHSGLETFTGGHYINGGARVKLADYTGGGTLTTGDYYVAVDGSFGITLPASPGKGHTLVLREFGGISCTVNRNGNNINFAAANFTLPANGTVRFIFDNDVAGGWVTFAA